MTSGFYMSLNLAQTGAAPPKKASGRVQMSARHTHTAHGSGEVQDPDIG